MDKTQKQIVIDLLSFSATRDKKVADHIHPDYVDHIQQITGNKDGFIKHLFSCPADTKRTIARVFQDGDYVFTHSEIVQDITLIGFDVFRFYEGKIIEHWENYQEKQPPNLSGRTMIDGATLIEDLHYTASNKLIVKSLIVDVFFNGIVDNISYYFNGTQYLQHNPWLSDELSSIQTVITEWVQEQKIMDYQTIHNILGEGNFVLVMSEGYFHDEHTSFYDLFRLENSKIAEHWDNFEAIKIEKARLNENSKF